MKTILSPMLALLLLTSCAYHSGMMTGNAELGPSSEIVNFAVGQSKSVLVFGIGGLNSKTLVKDAKEDLYSRYPLKKGEAYANVVVDFQRANYLIVFVNTATVSADIVKLDGSKTYEELQPAFSEKPLQAEADLYADLWVQPGDSVYFVRFKKFEKVFVSEILSKKKVSVTTAENKITNAKISKLYLFEKDVAFPEIPFKIGDFVSYKLAGPNGTSIRVSAEVKGLYAEKILIGYGDKIAEVEPDEVSLVD